MKSPLAKSIAALALLAVPAWAGTFTVLPLTGDLDSGISADKAYTLAIDMGDGANRTINGAVFTGSGAPGTNNFFTTGVTDTLNNWPVVDPPGALACSISSQAATGSGIASTWSSGGRPVPASLG